MKKAWLFLALVPSLAWGDISAKVNYRTQDATVSAYPYQAKFSNGSLTDNGDGTVSVNTVGTFLTTTSTSVINSSTFTIVNSTGPFSNLQNNLSTGAIVTQSIQLMVGSAQALCPLDVYLGNSFHSEQIQTTGTHYFFANGSNDMARFYSGSTESGWVDSSGGLHWVGTAAFPTAGNFYNASVAAGQFYRSDPGSTAQLVSYDLLGGNNTFSGSLIVNNFVSVTHFSGASSTPGGATGTGAGTNATASIAGTDLSGTFTVNTSALDTPAANADIFTATFNVTWGGAPRCIVMASNDAAANLAYGVWRYRQSDTTTTTFKIRSGNTPLTALTAATYTWNWICIQ